LGKRGRRFGELFLLQYIVIVIAIVIVIVIVIGFFGFFKKAAAFSLEEKREAFLQIGRGDHWSSVTIFV